MTLTTRETEILNLIWNGCQNSFMAKELGISIRTVETHRRNIYRKLRVNNVAQLIQAAFDRKLITKEAS